MTTYRFGDVVIVRFPFTDQLGFKQRPAAVISSTAYNDEWPDVILMAITSRAGPTLQEVEPDLFDWQQSGLLRPSILKPVLFTAEKALVHKTIGRLSNRDQRALRSVLKRIVG